VTIPDPWPVCASLIPAREPSNQARNLPRLLYVDRNMDTLVAFTALLAMSGYLPLSMQSPLIALGLARSAPLTLAVLNYDLPVMNGLELAEKIRQARPTLPIVLLSDSSPVRENAATVVNYLLPKDKDLKRLLRTINLVLGRDLAA
jgi:CheY-like chemotaxis protein